MEQCYSKMYCPVVGCNSDSQKSDRDIAFFSFPGRKSREQQKRRAAWIEFCKREKRFKPSVSTRICSRHFDEDAYDPAHSPVFLKQIGYTEKFKVYLKDDSLPTLNKPPTTCSLNSQKPGRIYSERRQQNRVSEGLEFRAILPWLLFTF